MLLGASFIAIAFLLKATLNRSGEGKGDLNPVPFDGRNSPSNKFPI
jgi:hypothetical protein